MAEIAGYLTFHIAYPGTKLTDGSSSPVGHMWYDLTPVGGQPQSFGFGPVTPGVLADYGIVTFRDNAKYTSYWSSQPFPLTADQYKAIWDFASTSGYGEYDTGRFSYIVSGKNCIKFSWDSAKQGGIGKNIIAINGALMPTDNIPLVEAAHKHWMETTSWRGGKSWSDLVKSQDTINQLPSNNGSTLGRTDPNKYYIEYGTTQPDGSKLRIEVSGDKLAALFYSNKLRPGDRGFAIIGADGVLSHLSSYYGMEITPDTIAKTNKIGNPLTLPIGQDVTIFLKSTQRSPSSRGGPVDESPPSSDGQEKPEQIPEGYKCHKESNITTYDTNRTENPLVLFSALSAAADALASINKPYSFAGSFDEWWAGMPEITVDIDGRIYSGDTFMA